MSKSKKITFIICGALYLICIIYNLTDIHSGGAAMIGLAGILLGAVLFLLGLIFSIAKETRDVGSAMLISAGVLFLIGVSVCSMAPIHI
ncbi:hypothetical protein [Ferruginibacter albus]|uniref:hypothetical protein n=1 Tax=Ferruginibacter albus TaxID=2875540 RepID=UPI001CC5214B|nr:hypothetical protein [Ferruginibacter albus]UAY51803.1 hypothetical protein K9M53_14570 [Ferruginibacter albus]